MNNNTAVQAAVAALVALLLLVTGGVVVALPDRSEPVDGTVVAVQVIEASMEELREQAIALPPGWLVIGCLLEALDPWLTKAFDYLRNDPLTALQARRWRAAYWDGLTQCVKWDFAGANRGLAAAFKELDIMVQRGNR